jgi:hypothetical protein
METRINRGSGVRLDPKAIQVNSKETTNFGLILWASQQEKGEAAVKRAVRILLNLAATAIVMTILSAVCSASAVWGN